MLTSNHLNLDLINMNKTDNGRPFVSVIIPVYNDRKRLILCLNALEEQSYPKDLYEVITIDNGSDEDINDLSEQYSNVFIFTEDIPGSYAARNKGIAKAKGTIFAFTDADCIPKFNWIEKGVEKFLQTPNCGLVGGKIDLFFQNSSYPTAVEIYESIEMDFPQETLLVEQRYAFTANVFTSKQVMDDVGIFNNRLKSGGDREWGRRIFNAGYEQVFAQEACVKHPARYSIWQLYKRITRINGGNFDASKGNISFKGKVTALCKDLMLAITPPFRSLFRIWTQEKRLSTNKQRFQFILVMLFVRYVSAWERIRLRLGGSSKRW